MAQGELDRGLINFEPCMPCARFCIAGVVDGSWPPNRGSNGSRDGFVRTSLEGPIKIFIADEWRIATEPNRLDDAERVFSQSLQSGDLPSLIQLAQIKLAARLGGRLESPRGCSREGQLPAMGCRRHGAIGCGSVFGKKLYGPAGLNSPMPVCPG